MNALKLALLWLGLVLIASEGAWAGNPMPTPAGNYFSGRNVLPPTQPVVRQPIAQPQPMATPAKGKPFQGTQPETTLSPYLVLDLVNENETSLPNYYAFYKPMREQQLATQAQEARLRRMQQQMRVADATGAGQGGVPVTGNSRQFMNLGGYFPGLR